MSPVQPARGEIWYVDLSPTRGHEQRGQRPALVVSVDTFNQGPADLVIVAPLTTTDRGIPLHVAIEPRDGGVRTRSIIQCDHIRCISRQRLTECWGRVSSDTMDAVAERLRIVLGL